MSEASPDHTAWAVGSGRLTGDETIDQIAERQPGLRLAMMSYGLCTCCSGGLTLRQAAAARGLPLRAVLEDLERERAKGT